MPTPPLWSREQAAVCFTSFYFELAVRKDVEKLSDARLICLSAAKVHIFLHIPILFPKYLMDSYHFQGLKGWTYCYYMHIVSFRKYGDNCLIFQKSDYLEFP